MATKAAKRQPHLSSPHGRCAPSFLILAAGIACVYGCHRPTPLPHANNPASIPAQTSPIGDPLTYLHRVRERAKALGGFEATFYRQERIGWPIPRLSRLEHIRAWFRAEPFSVKFRWLNPDSDYVEAAYIAGRNDGRLTLLPRRGLLPGFPPKPIHCAPEVPVRLHRARNPITDFGPARLMERTLSKIEQAERLGGATVHYLGLARNELLPRPVHRFRIEYPAAPQFTCPVQDLLVDPKTQLPAGTFLWRADGQLDMMYVYTDIVPRDDLTDADFAITASKGLRKKSKSAKRSTAASTNPKRPTTRPLRGAKSPVAPDRAPL